MKDGTPVGLGGVIASRRSRKDKRDREYAIVTVEDFDDGIEVLVFHDQLEQCRPLLQPDTLVVVQGTVKVRATGGEAEGAAFQGIPQVWADRVLRLQECDRYLKTVVLRVHEHELDEVLMLKLKERMAEHPGEGYVYLELLQEGGGKRRVRVREFRVAIDNRLLAALREVLGPDRVALVGELPPCGRNSRPLPRPNRPSPESGLGRPDRG
jgi:DNA polymerase III alpha subunit